MSLEHPSARWLKRLVRDGRPIYLGIVAALDAAVREGELQPGDQLPPQRTVAGLLGVDFTTVTRAYAAARRRGLVEAAVGRGTFVRARAADDEAGLIDLSMNLPPPPDGISLAACLKETVAAILDRTDAATLMAYHPGAGTLGQKAAGAAWLAPCLGDIAPERVLVCPGAQSALAALLAALVPRGGGLVVDPLTYPGIKALAAALGLRLLPCAIDGEGVLPDALERLCRQERPAAIYLIPTLQNPMAFTLGVERRRAVAELARAHDLQIIEDDPYSRLLDAPPPALASFAPERAFHLATLSKTLSPGLRTAFLACPPGPAADRVQQSLRALALMPAPLMAAVAASWIREGVADRLLAGVRREARARRALAAGLLPAARGAPEGVHLWLPLPEAWPPERLHRAAQDRGLSLVTAEAFATGETWPGGVRISLGGPAKRAVLAQALSAVAALLNDAPTARLVV